MSNEQLKNRLERKVRRLELYYKREEKMLTDGVQSYGTGSRNLARYQTDLRAIQDTIKALEIEIKELERKIKGIAPRKKIGTIIRDW